MHEIIAAFIEQHQLLPEHGTVVVAVSGGVDSLCLLHILHGLCGPDKRYPDVCLHVAHLNHQLRGSAGDQDARVVAAIAASWGLPATVGSVDVPALARRERRSLEDAAREARYRFLRDVAQGQPIAVAHHLDDQVETILLHWLRGGGITAMVGLQPRLQDIIRPLLAVSRAAIVAYCQQHQLVPVEDASNTDTRFLRNRVRHDLLPLLEAINPGIRETLLRNAETLHVDVEWIEAQVDQCWVTTIITEDSQQISLSIDRLLALPLSLQRHLLRRLTAQLHAGQSPLELRHYRLLEQLVQRPHTTEELTLHLPGGLHVVRQGQVLLFKREILSAAKNDRLWAENEEVILSIPGQVTIPGTPWTARAEVVPENIMPEIQAALLRDDWRTVWSILPACGFKVYVDGTDIGDTLQVRTRRAGDRIRPLGMAHEKKIQDILVNSHVPRSERGHIPLFFSASHCIWLAGIHLDDRVRLTAETQRIVCLSIIHTL